MKKSLLLYELSAMIRKPVPLFLSLFLPFFLLGVIGFTAYSFTQTENITIEVAIVDEDMTFETRALIHQLQDEEELKETLTFIPKDKEGAEHAMEIGEISGMLLIPEGFTKDLRVGKNTPITVITNKNQVLNSYMIKLLLDSGAQYISAAQSGVNAVYDLYIKDIEQSNQRSELTQQTIISFTLYALSRNDLFEKEIVNLGSSLGWTSHIMFSYLLTSTLLSIILYQFLTYRKYENSIIERLRTLNILQVSQVWNKLLSYTLFIWFSCLLYSVILESIVNQINGSWVDFPLQITLLIFSLLLSSIAVLIETIFKDIGVRCALLLTIVCTEYLLSGIWIPEIYLPQGIREVIVYQPFYSLYEAYEQNLLTDMLPLIHWGLLICWIAFFILLAIGVARLKEGKDAYLSISSR